MQKKELRKLFYQKNKEFSSLERKRADKRLAARINSFLHKRGYRELNILAYFPYPSEPPVLNFLENPHVRIYLPRIAGKRIIPMDLITGSGIAKRKLDYIFVPGLFITRKGRRLGRGAGYYDRYLVSYPKNRRIFIGYHWQIRDDLPVEPWDRSVGRWISDEGSGLCLQ